ncbi:MAG TPA: ABC transporter permease [Candidatus Limnocylindrales bacterium]|nr:ABC transporter permease [Candidatus Limnocylindrales bacterium]
MATRFIVRRFAQAALTIFLIVILNFILFRAMPGSPDRVLARNPNVSPEAIQQIRERWGIDKPLIPDQLIAYIGATFRGDLGNSFAEQGRPVTEVVGSRLGPTLLLFGLGEIIAIVIGLALGAYAGWRRGGPLDLVGNGVSLILYSMPYFLLGMILLLIFASTLHWFPSFGMTTLGVTHDSPLAYLADVSAHLVLPVATVALGLIGQYSILMRSSIIETMSDEYITTARAKGITDSRVLRGHALPNAMLPTVSLIAINLGYVVAGAITVEVVFNWPGLGTLTVDALKSRDYAVLQGIFLVLSVSVVFANLGADMIYGRLDPRVRA